MVLERIVMHRRIVAWLLAAAASAFGLSACSSLPPAPAKAPVAAHQYSIGPGDTLIVDVWRNPELSVTTQVRPDGRISTPLVNDLPAAGKSPSELANNIQEALKKYVQEPIVTVRLQGPQGSYEEQIRVVGEAAKPQAIPYKQGMTLLDVMITVGGLTDYADGNGAILVRAGKQYRVRLRDLVKRGDIGANVEVAPGDVLIIPQSLF